MSKKKQLTAAQLLSYLILLQEAGNDLEKIKVNYRKDYDSDVRSIKFVEEDLYDEKTNSILTDIVMVSKNK
jgi:hypothetical protein